MSRKKKTIVEADGTPIEVDADDDAVASRDVMWTLLGETSSAHSEHGVHVADEVVNTVHADVLIERGFAREVDDALPVRSPTATERTEYKPDGDA